MKPLSTMDAAFLYMEQTNTPMHVGGLHLFRYPKGAGEGWLQNALSGLDQAAPAQPPFNFKLAQPLSRLRLPHWVVDEGIDLDYHVRHSALPKPGRYRELFSLISRLHSTQLHRDRPLWEMHFIEGLEGGRFALYGKMHHALVDGVSATRLFRSTMTTNSRQRNMPPLWAVTRPSRDDSVSRGALRAIADNLQSQLGAVPGAVRGMASFAGGVLKRDPYGMVAPYAAPRTSFNGRISAARRFVAQSWSMSRIKQVAKPLDATVNDIVLAMSASALRKYLLSHGELPEKPLTAMAPVSVHAVDSAELGNAVSAILVSLATDIADPGERLRAIRHSIGEGKALLGSMTRSEILLYTNFTSLPNGLPLILKVGGYTRPPFNLTISNVPGPRERLYWNGARLDGSYPVSIVVDGSAINITVSSYAGSLDFGIIACRRSVPGAQRLIDYLEDGLAELEAVAGK